MRVLRGLILAAGLLAAAPAAAQQASAQQNLDCAIWAAYQVGVAQNDEVANGFSIAVSWFIGLYEGQTGQLIDAPMRKRSAELDEAGIARLTGPCLGRFSAFADRLGTLGQAMSQ